MAIVWYIMVQVVCVQLASGSVINVALRKPANMSSRHFFARDPGVAVDGNTTAVDPVGVIHTAVNHSDAWWWVDLQTQVQDATVKIYFRIDYKIRRNGVQLYTSTTFFTTYPSGDLCYTVTGSSNGRDIPDVVSVNCSGTWRYLMVYTNTDNSVGKTEGPILDFGEVEVLVCSNETYGTNCTKSCGSRQCTVTSTSCDRYTGTCPGGCRAGWMGADCTQECMRDKYGAGCSMVCADRHCSRSSSCNNVTGQCDNGCQPGWIGTDCIQVCMSNMYGPGCNSSCANRHCSGSSSCHHETGQCNKGCLPGWSGIDCLQECLAGTYGANCVKACSARQCRMLPSSCDRETGQCSDRCQDGWGGQDCIIQCPSATFGISCLNCSIRHCQGESDCPGDGTCSGGCQDGWTLNNCTQEIQARSSEVDQTPMIAGTVTAVVVIIIVVLVVIGVMWRRRRLKRKATPRLYHVYYNDVDASVKVKDDASTEIADHSVPVGVYDRIDMSRDKESLYTTIVSVDNKDKQESVGVANTMSDINGRDEHKPMNDGTYETLDTPSHDGVYTDLQSRSSYQNLKGRDK